MNQTILPLIVVFPHQNALQGKTSSTEPLINCNFSLRLFNTYFCVMIKEVKQKLFYLKNAQI